MDAINLEKLMMKREYFPVEIALPPALWPVLGESMPSHNMPPMHPLLKENGIPIQDTELMILLVYNALKNTALDLVPYSKSTAETIDAFSEDELRQGVNKCGLGYSEDPSFEHYVSFNNLPVWDRLTIKKRRIQQTASDNYIEMNNTPRGAWMLPKTIKLPDELVEEYGLKMGGVHPFFASVRCPYEYHFQNLTLVGEIFLGDFIIELDNYFVRQKYSL
jgi:hypothetical protein